MDAKSHYAYSTTTPPPSATGSMIQRIRKASSEHKHKFKWITIATTMVLILIAVVLTGIFFSRTDKKAKAKHDVKSGADLEGPFNDPTSSSLLNMIFLVNLNQMNADDPSITYNIEGAFFDDNDVPTNVTVCAQILDSSSFDPPSALTFSPPKSTHDEVSAYRNATTRNVTMDGFLSRYPLDVYSGSMSVLVYIPHDPNTLCDDILYEDGIDTIVPSLFAFGQNLEGFVSSNKAALVSQPDDIDSDVITFLGSGTVNLAFNVRRVRVIQFFSLIMFITTWLLTLGVIFATIQVLFHNKDSKFELVAAGTALLFALPTLRAAQPGIPTTPTTYDTVGYFWNIALLAISTFVLICHGIYHLEVDKKESKCACRCATVEEHIESAV